jgi:hypothetical protein
VNGKKYEPKKQGFTNETALETRVVDQQPHMSQKQTENQQYSPQVLYNKAAPVKQTV